MLHVVVIDIVDEQSVILELETEKQGFHLTELCSNHIFYNNVY